MKLATYRDGAEAKVGAVHGGDKRLLDLAAAAQRNGSPVAAFGSMLALIDAGPAALDTARQLVERYADDSELNRDIGSVQLLSPVPEPRQMRDFSVYPSHIRNAPAGMQRYMARQRGDNSAAAAVISAPDVPPVYRAQPIYYKANRFSVIGTEETVRWPRYSKLMDFELEFGIFLGRGGSNIARQEARSHIFGFTIFNDFSARDAQQMEMQGMLGPCKGKDFDTGNAIGPWLVTADEIADPYSLAVAVRVNGETWSSGSSAGMLHDFEDMIAFVSRDETLHAGEFFGSGTVNDGCGLELDRFLKHGDVVEIEVEGIGVLRNTVLRQDQAN
jgi:2-keto-4-pentenoate hydratase/2-oxohepta-3-ene-1,7-dioic acid hydratase in catechol pathway